MSKTLLVIAAHPDDEVLGCGATVALRKKQGWQTHLLVLTKGVLGRETTEKNREAHLQAIESLQAQTRAAADVLGFNSIAQLDFPDNRMDSVSRMDIAHSITDHLNTIRPNVVFTHHPGDYNWDHTLTFEAVLMAARQNPGDFAPDEILSFEVLSSTERGYAGGGRGFHPTTYVNVAKTIDKKKLALSYYTSEYRPYPHPRSIEAVEYLARKRGNEVGIEYAEAFELIRSVEK